VGLNTESPAEIVLTTFYPDKRPHASTIGVKASGKSKVLLRIFTATDTFRNITKSKAAIINIVGDVKLLANLALKDLLGFKESMLSFENSKYVDAPRLKGADAHIEIEVKTIRKKRIFDELGTSEVAHLTAEVKNIDVKNPRIHPPRRSESFVIESAIMATRAMVALKRGEKKIAKKLFRRLNDYKEECELIAPNSRESCLIAKIANSLKRWGQLTWRGSVGE
jgi:hypothetical protein